MLGIALEGGGAKGAFHMGALQACVETGNIPAAIAGTSIGAMNAAMFAQGDFEKALELWQRVSGSDVFTPDDEKLIYADLQKLDLKGFVSILEAVRQVFSEGGIDNTNMKKIIDDYIDPQKLMASPMDFGIVTFALPELKPVEIFKKDMGLENIKTYILASAAFPGFQRVSLGGSHFVDGGVYDNCPVNMLLERGCRKVIAVRTNAVGITRYDESDPRVITVVPSEDLGSLMRFSPEVSKRNIKMGYFDAMRVLRGLWGTKYYILTPPQNPKALFMMEREFILKAAESFKIKIKGDVQRVLFEKLLPKAASRLNLDEKASYGDIITALSEKRASAMGLDRFAFYRFPELVEKVRDFAPRKPDGCDILFDGYVKAAFPK